MKHRYLLIALPFILLSCKDFFIKDKEFSMKTIPYTGDELKINGYYYKECDNKYSQVFVFYANGVQYGGNGVTTSTEIENRLLNPDFNKIYKDLQQYWGPFEINSNDLKFEFYDIFGNNWHTCIAHCKILNDTTFNVEKITFSKTGKEVNVNMEGTSSCFLGEFYFKQFYPKPDSTNNFIP